MLVEGAVYSVSWDDCCTAGRFVASLGEKVWDADEPDFLSELRFTNGVTLSAPLYGVTFYEASAGESINGE